MLERECARSTSGIAAGFAHASGLDAGTDERAQGVGRRRFFGEQHDVAVVLARESQQPPLPCLAPRRRRSLCEVDDDDAERPTAQEQLGGFAERMGLGTLGVRPTRQGNVHDEQGFEVDAACVEVGRVERAPAGLNPRRGFAGLLCIANHTDCRGGACGGHGCLGIAGELEQTARADRLVQRLSAVGLGLGLRSRVRGRACEMGQTQQRSGHAFMVLLARSVSTAFGQHRDQHRVHGFVVELAQGAEHMLGPVLKAQGRQAGRRDGHRRLLAVDRPQQRAQLLGGHLCQSDSSKASSRRHGAGMMATFEPVFHHILLDPRFLPPARAMTALLRSILRFDARPRLWASSLGALLCTASLSVGLVGCDEQESTQLDEKVAPHVRAAEVRLIEPRPRSRHLAPLQAHRRARLSPRTGGQVLVLSADEEQRVKQGAVLVRFAALDSKGGLMSAKASITQIKESLGDAKRELEDARDLVSKGAGTTREVERLETQIATLEAQLSNAKGTLVQAKDRVGAATLVAPFAGTITAVDTEVGEFVAPGVVAVVLAELDPIAVEVPLTQAEVETYDREGGLSFEVRAREVSVDAQLEYISSESTDGSTFTARLKIPNEGERLRSGELVDVEVYGAARTQVKAVPFTAVRWAADQAYLLSIADDGTLARIDITVVDESEESVIVEGDITPGTRVVETGPTALREGDTVEVVAAPGETLAAG